MTIAGLHSGYAVKIDSTLIGGITQQQVNTGTTIQRENTSGQVYPAYQAISDQRPMATFTTKQINKALAAAGVVGANIGALTAGLTLYAFKHAQGSTRASGSAHKSYAIADGILVPRRLDCTHQQDALLSYEALAISDDGVNAPVIIADGVAAPGSVVDDEHFTLGPIDIAGVALTGFRSVSIDFGIDAQTQSADGDVWPTYASIISVRPVITLRGIDVDWFKAANIPLAGKAATHANTAIYLRKRSADGLSFLSNVTAEHILLTCAGIAYVEMPQDVSGTDLSECSLRIEPHYDGTNTPLLFDTTSAIT